MFDPVSVRHDEPGRTTGTAFGADSGTGTGTGSGSGSGTGTGSGSGSDRRLPPIPQLGIGALVLTVASGIYLAALAQRHPSIVAPTVLLAGAAGAMLSAVVLLVRARVWTWPKFTKVFGWAILEYSVIAGMLVYVFLLDHIPQPALELFLVALVIFAFDIPMMFGFAVARYQEIPEAVPGS